MPNETTARKVRGCTGKKRHATAGDAVVFALRASRHLGPLRPYKCGACHYWHLTKDTEGRGWIANHG